jgi:hypothetical protein
MGVASGGQAWALGGRMNLEALFVIGGLALALLIVLGTLAVWISRRSKVADSPSPSLTGTGLALFGAQIILMLVCAVVAQMFTGLWKLLFVITYLAVLMAVLMLIAKALRRRGYPPWLTS